MTRRSVLALSAALVAVTVVAGTSSAQAVTHDATTQKVVDALPNYLTSFNQIGGMAVTWTDAFGTCTQDWGQLSVHTWGVSGANCSDGSDFSLSAHGTDQAYFSLWNLQGTGVTQFSIYALSGDAVFDDGSTPSTPGSSLGTTYDYCAINLGFFCLVNTQDHWNTTATYSDEVAVSTLNGGQPYGDLWGELTVDFGSTFGVADPCPTRRNPNKDCGQYDVTFAQDVDQATGGSAGIPEENVTPEPATMSLLAMGLIGLAAERKRRRRS